MEKTYLKISSDTMSNLSPKEETVNFLLDYSKALSVIDCYKWKFEALLN
ncbi:MAG: hypothetical protein H0X63_04515 [Flavobacteriales bacterium]|nr:hypothetical protein [Flavobacteriales bacterium]